MENTNSTKGKIQSGAVTAVKVVTYPLHLVAQSTADLINIGQAKAINAIDGTPMFDAMTDCQSWTQTQQAKVIAKGLEIKERMRAQRESNRKQDIAKYKAKLDELEGVENVIPVPTPASVTPEALGIKTEKSIPEELTLKPVTPAEAFDIPKPIEATVVPAPPVEKSKRNLHNKKQEVPTMK